jgi:hypothetical protein
LRLTVRPYIRDRLIDDRPEGFVVIVPVDAEPSIPLACPICRHVMRSRDDEVSYNEFQCCDRCARLWAHPNRQAWKDGWRPSAEQVQEAEVDRVPLTLVFRAD